MVVESIVQLIMGHILYWSRFVLLIALIYALVKLFIGGEDESSGGSWRDSDSPSSRDGWGRSDSRPPDTDRLEPDNLEPDRLEEGASPDMNDVSGLLDEYERALRAWQELGNRTLQQHHDYIQSLGQYGANRPPVSPEQFAQCIAALQDLQQRGTRLNERFRQIIDDDGFPRMQGANDLIHLAERWALLLREERTYTRHFAQRLHRGDAP